MFPPATINDFGCDVGSTRNMLRRSRAVRFKALKQLLLVLAKKEPLQKEFCMG